MEKLTAGWIRLVLRNRWLVLLALLLLTGISGLSVSRAVLATSMMKLLFGDAPEHAVYLEQVRRFGTDRVLMLGYETDDPLDPAMLASLERVVEQVEALPDVARVHSVLDAYQLRMDSSGLRQQSYAEAAMVGSSDHADLLEALRSDPLVAGQLVSADGRHGALIIELRTSEDDPALGGPSLVHQVYKAFQQQGFTAASLHRAGFVALVAEFVEQTAFNLACLFPLTLLAVVLTVYAAFRRLLPVLVSVGVAGLATFWTMGLAVQLDRQVNIFIAMVPTVVLVVAISDVIHLYSAYLLELRAGASKQAAIQRSASEVGAACLLTSLTTFAGFLALCFVPSPIYRQLGLVLGFGVAVALLLALTVMPVLLSLLPTPAGPQLRAGPAVTERGLRRLVDLVTARPWTIIAAFAGLALVIGLGLNRMTISADILRRMPEGSEIRDDASWFDQHLPGTTVVQVFLDTHEPEGALDPALIADVRRFSERARQLSDVDGVLSLADLLTRVHAALGGNGALPATRAAVAQELLVFDLSGEQDLERLLDFERQRLQLLVRTRPTDLRHSHELRQQLQQLARETIGEQVAIHATGVMPMLGSFMDVLIAGQRRGLLAACLVVALMMMLGMRSWRVGLWSMLPNLLPPLAVAGLAGLLWTRVDIDVLVVAVIAIGVGVDDTIHFLMRYRIESSRAPPAQAIERSFQVAGRAIVFTTVILVLGFLPLALGQYHSVRVMGLFLPFALLVALAADLLLLPALIRVGLLRFGAGRRRR